MIKPINVSKKLSDGREISIETGKLAKQADGCINYGEDNDFSISCI